MKITIILYALVFNTCFVLAQNNPNTLVYKQPAGNFQQGLPLGNGRLGAMVFGDVTQEKIMLNEDSFWSGEPVDVTIPGAQEIVLQIQKASARFR